MSNNNAACLIVGFLRVDNILKLMELIQTNGIREIYLSIDGPRNDNEKKIQEDLLRELEEVRFEDGTNLHLWRRKVNLGAAVSVIKSIDWISETNSEFIVLEDDLLPSSHFFNFATIYFKHFAKTEKILLVSGNNFFDSMIESKMPLFSCHPLIWGWATTAANWKIIRNGILYGTQARSINRNLATKSFLRAGRIRALKGKIDAWDIPLADYMFRSNSLCLLPPVNLVTNLGSDQFATHTTSDNWPIGYKISSLPYLPVEYLKNIQAVRNVELDRMIETKLYGIKYFHIASQYLVKLLDLIRNRKSKFEESLIQRTQFEAEGNEFRKFNVTTKKFDYE